MPSADTLVCLTYGDDIRRFGKLCETANRVVFALLTAEGYHLSIHQKSRSSEIWAEYSSSIPIGSVWDTARINLARKCGYKNPERHACYVVNGPVSLVSHSDVSLLSHKLAVNDFQTTIRARHARLPRVTIKAPGKTFELNYYFSPDRTLTIPDSTVFQTNIGNLILNITA